MARHSNGKNNYSLSAGAIVVLLVLALAIAGVIWYFAARDDVPVDTAASEETCVAGDLTLPVAASDSSTGQALIDAYGQNHPVVRDFCVRPELVTDLAAAAVYIAPNTSVTHQEIANAGRNAAVSDPQPVSSDTVGLAGNNTVDPDQVALDNVRFPVAEEPAASAIAASLIAENDNDAVKALTDQRIASLADFAAADGRFVATVGSSTPEGLQFTPLAGDVVYTAIPLNQSDSVDENQARAGQDFARASAERFDGSVANQPVIPELVWAAALPTGGENITSGTEEKLQPENTLFLLDTSEAMAPHIDLAAKAIAQAARDISAAGYEVGLWNYSSPLNPGVVVGYRQNISVSPGGDDVATAVARFLTGGVPQTREALEAAVSAYADAPAKTRIVLVTTGTADSSGNTDDDSSYVDVVANTAGDKVDLSVVHVGSGQPDAAVEQLAQVKERVAGGAGEEVKMAAAVEHAAGLSE